MDIQKTSTLATEVEEEVPHSTDKQVFVFEAKLFKHRTDFISGDLYVLFWMESLREWRSTTGCKLKWLREKIAQMLTG